MAARADTYRFDLPFGAAAPRIVNPELGLARVITRGDHHNYAMTVIVLDAADHRLVRSGVLLARRSCDDNQQWYLAAPQWSPLLPEERVFPAESEALPSHLVDAIRPFLRRAELVEVATLTSKRTEYHLRDQDNHELALLRDEQVTVRRGGLTTARYREVTVEMQPELNDDQRQWIGEAIVVSGGTRVAKFPDLVSRLGAPATGMTDIPTGCSGRRADTLEEFVRCLLGRVLRSIVQADLAGEGELAMAFLNLRKVLLGLYPVLDRAWLDDCMAEIDQALDTDEVGLSEDQYLSVVEKLVVAARSPKLGAISRRPAAAVLAEELAAALATFISRGEALSVDSDDQQWEDMSASAENVAYLAHVAKLVVAKKVGRLETYMITLRMALAECSVIPTDVEWEDAPDVTAQQAFQAGRIIERTLIEQQAQREDFVARWRKHARQLRNLAVKA